MEVEEKVCRLAIEKPAWWELRVSNELKLHGIFVSPTGVQSIRLRHDLRTFKKRLKALAAQDGLVLSQEQLRALEKARQVQEA